MFVKILHKRAIEASDEVRATPDIRPGDIVEIRLVLLIFFSKINIFNTGFRQMNLMVISFCSTCRKFPRTSGGYLFTKVL